MQQSQSTEDEQVNDEYSAGALKKQDKISQLVNRFLQFQWKAFKGEDFSPKSTASELPSKGLSDL